jgi:hypothetical protein
MNNLARTEANPVVFQECARVVQAQGRQCRLQSAGSVYDARQAVSCLLTPKVGDRVLAAIDETGQAYVLAILEREDNTDQQIDLQGEVRLNVCRGRLKITSQEGMDLASAGDIRTISEDLEFNAVKGRVNIQDGTYQGSVLSASVGKIKWLADRVDSMVERLTQRVKRLYRTVDEFEQVRAGRMDYQVEKLLSFSSQYTVMTSKEDVKVDAERIHIG